jgi:hypothetical protein
MNLSDEAVLLWPVLVLAARNQQILSYGEIYGFTGIPAVGQGRPLGLIDAYCQSKGFPRLNVIAVSRETGLPGDKLPAPHMTQEGMMIEKAKVFVFDWSAVEPKPRREDFPVSP